MPDITMCSGEGCPLKQECYRANAFPSQFAQSWFQKAPVNPDGTCAEFIEPRGRHAA